MPIPVWLLEFREERGRDPLPSEIAVGRRRGLLRYARYFTEKGDLRMAQRLRSLVGLSVVQ